jgi:hypothetical protein
MSHDNLDRWEANHLTNDKTPALQLSGHNSSLFLCGGRFLDTW